MLKAGKLDSDLLKELVFEKITYRSDDVRVRPGIGEDCAVINFGENECIMSTDPITSAVNDIGRLAIHITCNDVASNGVQPLGIMLAVMLPIGTSEEDVAYIMGQAAETAASLEVEIIGGHTEITPAVKQPVIVSTAIGKTVSGGSQSGDEMESGDYIMMTKSVGLEGTGIIAYDYSDRLADIMTEAEIERAKSFLDCVSVVKEGIVAGTVGTHGMHDITEGGILGAVWEMCQISGRGAQLWRDAIPVEKETIKVCEKFDINPLRLISSGSMVIIVSPERKQKMLEEMEKAGVSCSVIGRIEDREFGIRLIEDCRDIHEIESGDGEIKSSEIDPPSADEIYKVVGADI